jgi:hypothetical protein
MQYCPSVSGVDYRLSLYNVDEVEELVFLFFGPCVCDPLDDTVRGRIDHGFGTASELSSIIAAEFLLGFDSAILFQRRTGSRLILRVGWITFPKASESITYHIGRYRLGRGCRYCCWWDGSTY